MKSVDWELVNVEELASRHPDSFFIPSLLERSELRVGTEVQLHFRVLRDGDNMPNAERMWVDVVEARSQRFVGELQNEPAAIRGLKQRDLVQFSPCHVGATLIRRSDPRWTGAVGKGALVSRLALEPGAQIRLAHLSEEAADATDSGWTFLTGEEAPETLEMQEFFEFKPVESLLDRAHLSDGLIQSTMPGEYRRDEHDKWTGPDGRPVQLPGAQLPGAAASLAERLKRLFRKPQ
jgi:hypothetical protein